MDNLLDAIEMPKLPENKKTYSGIPEAVFIEDIDAYMAKPENDNNCDKVLIRLDEQHNKYSYMSYNLDARKAKLKMQLPDLMLSLKMIDVMRKEEEDKETQFCLSDQVYIKTIVPPSKTVYLWLGANVMLEYPLDEAEVLLKSNLEAAGSILKTVEHDKDFLRDQITTTEVNMARVYNWGVKRRQAAVKNAGGASTSSEAAAALS